MYDHQKEYQLNKFNEDSIINHLKYSEFYSAEIDGVEILAEKLYDGLDESESLDLEIKTICKFGRITHGGCLTNLTDGGDGGNTLVDPIVRDKWERAMKEVNARPEVKAKRTASAKRMWLDPDFRVKISKAHSISDRSTSIAKSRLKGWSDNRDKWILAENIYEIWLDRGKPSYRRLSNHLIELGYPFFQLQKTIKYFQIIDPREDPLYQSWKINTQR